MSLASKKIQSCSAISLSCFVYLCSAQICWSESGGITLALTEMAKAGGVINNDVLTEICKLGSPITESNEDYHRLDGAPVEIVFNVQKLSKKTRTLSGSFAARSGAFAEDIVVDVDFSNVKLPLGIEKGASIQVTGELPSNGNDFRGNSIDSCFIYFVARSVELDGF
jgi:hypothetical protein